MKNPRTSAIILLALAPFAHAGGFHVSTVGSDAPGDGSTQKPFASLEKARDAVREVKRQNGHTGDCP